MGFNSGFKGLNKYIRAVSYKTVKSYLFGHTHTHTHTHTEYTINIM